jgi:hypothetical protein
VRSSLQQAEVEGAAAEADDVLLGLGVDYNEDPDDIFKFLD